MENQLNELLRHVLSPVDEPSFGLNQKIIYSMMENNEMARSKKRRFPAVAAVAALVMCLSSLTVYAAIRYLSPAEVAEEIQDVKLAEVFVNESAIIINDTQSYGDYRVALLGIVSGEMLSDYPRYKENNAIAADRTYAVVSIENVGGMPMPNTSEDGYGEVDFFASPLIAGYNPVLYNIASMSGNYADITEDGVLYRLIECDNIEIFANHKLYLCVSEGTFYNTEAFDYDELTGEISRKEAYGGLNALFDLPVDAAKANPEKATEYIVSLGLTSDIRKEKVDVELEEAFEVKMEADNKEGAEVAEYALQFVGNPYAWGESSLTEGTDSSGFIKSVYAYFGVELPHASKEQAELGMEVEVVDDALPGDLVFYDTPSHVAIYLGEGYIVHSLPQEGICVSEVDFDEISGIRRIMNVE